MKHTFHKNERLCSKKRIETLFAGDSRVLSAYPLRAVYKENDIPTRMPSLLISVSKRHFKHAIDRNLVKRRIREAYRTNRHLLLDSLKEGQHIDLAFIWMSDKIGDFFTVETRMKNLLHRILEDEKY